MKKYVIDVEFTEEEIKTSVTEEEIKTSYFSAKLNAYVTGFIAIFFSVGLIWHTLEIMMYGYTIKSLEDTIIGILFSIVLTYFIVNRRK